MATRYEKTARNHLATVQLGRIRIRTRLVWTRLEEAPYSHRPVPRPAPFHNSGRSAAGTRGLRACYFGGEIPHRSGRITCDTGTSAARSML